MVKTFKELLDKIKIWFETDIPANRLNLDRDGRKWFLKSIGYTESLKMSDLKAYCDRTQLNQDYKKRFNEKNVKARKGISAIKAEISMMYSFNKCFVARHKSRLQYYKDDMSQKGARNMYCVWQSHAIFTEFKKNLDS